MSIKEPRIHKLKVTKSFGDYKKGSVIKAVITNAFVRDMIEGCTLKFENGDELNIPYDWFRFVEDDKDKQKE